MADKCVSLAEEMASYILLEFMDPCKALNNYVSALYGKHSVKLTSEEDRHASICLLANNHSSEQLFGTFTEAFVTEGRIDHHKAVRAGQSRYNGDFSGIHLLSRILLSPQELIG